MLKHVLAVAIIAALIAPALTIAQPYAKSKMLSVEQQKKKALNFYDLQENFYRYWNDKKVSVNEEENAKEGGYQQFKRAEWFLKPRVYPSGNFNSEILFNEFKKYEVENANKTLSINTANWTLIGPDVIPGDGGGLGRINCMAFYPNQPDTLFVGAACGGLWRSNNGGTSWTSNTDLLPSLSISEIVINPNNPDTMYLATGDKYGIYFQYEVTGHYSAGILISADGGATWNQASMNYAQAQNVLFQRLIINPNNPSILIVATSNGIYRTTDAGATWNSVQSGGMFYDVEFNTANPSIVYAVSETTFYRSTDDGATWAPYGNMGTLGGDRSSIAVTPADANSIFVWDNTTTLYYSNNGGTTFTTRTSPGGAAGPYGYYDNVISCSPLNTTTLYAGGLNIAKSIDGGLNWTTVSDWNGWPAANYTHADHHAIEFFPGSNDLVYACNDGGIFKTLNGGNLWTDVTGGIAISQFYRFGNDQSNPSLLLTGAQDNGTNLFDGTTWTRVNGADGMECMIDYNNPLNMYVSSQGGYMYKSVDGGNSFNSITPCTGDWTTPMEMHPTNSNTIYSACADVWESIDGGQNWTQLSTGLSPANLFSLKISSSNPNYIYAASISNVYRTTNHGSSWNNITSNLPVGSAAITMLSIKDNDPDQVWVTFSGYANGEKVYYTNNGGTSWVNISGTLPNIPVNCITYQNNSNDIVYIGTDFGVFYTDNTLNDWLPYNTGLPNVIIDELEIQYTVSKLRAATFGRSVWESDLVTSVLFQTDVGVFAIISPNGNYCDSIINPIVRIRNYGIDTLTSFTLTYFLDANTPQALAWNGTLIPNTTVDITLPAVTVAPGLHTYTAYTSSPNGGADLNINNDSRTNNFNISTIGVPTPIAEGYELGGFPPGNWTMTNGGGLLSLYTGTGGFGLSTHCMKADFYSIQSGTAHFISPKFNLLNVVPPAKIYFDVAYAQYNNTYHDTLFVSVSADCGVTFTKLYTKGDAALSTAGATTSIFVPTATQWRRDSVDISAYIGNPSITVRFETKSGFGNNLYIDNINLIGSGFVGISNPDLESSQIRVYPNPALTIFNVEVLQNTTPYSLQLTNPLGQMVWHKNNISHSGIEQIDVTEMPKGIYFLSITANGNKKVMKLVKQ